MAKLIVGFIAGVVGFGAWADEYQRVKAPNGIEWSVGERVLTSAGAGFIVKIKDDDNRPNFFARDKRYRFHVQLDDGQMTYGDCNPEFAKRVSQYGQYAAGQQASITFQGALNLEFDQGTIHEVFENGMGTFVGRRLRTIVLHPSSTSISGNAICGDAIAD